MKFIDKLERKFGKYAIHGFIRYIVMFNAVVFALTLFAGPRFTYMLTLEPDLIMQGQIWRLFTFLFIPDTFSPIWIIFSLYLMYMIGNSLEMYWGAFKLNLYYLIGVIATIALSMFTGVSVSSMFVNTSIFLAFAFINPDLEFLIFFILPIKVKYLAYIQWFFIGYNIVLGNVHSKLAALASSIAFFIFFGPEIIYTLKGNRRAKANRAKFEANMPKFDASATLHKCEICGITDKDDPHMEFRYCSKCAGLHEYCMKHINNHEHIK